MKKRNGKRYQEMTTAELREATREFDKEFVAEKARPMSSKERAMERRLRRHRGRPRIGKGAEKINVSLERGLLAAVNQFARANGIRRSTLISQALAQMIGRKAS